MSSAKARRGVLSLLAASAISAWCGYASGLPQSSSGAALCFALSVVFVVVSDVLLFSRTARRPRPPAYPPARTSIGLSRCVAWLVLFLVVVTWEALGIDTGPATPHLTISALALSYRGLDAALLLIWILVGLAFGVVRARAAAPRRSEHQPVTSPPGSRLVPALGFFALSRLRPLALLLPASRPAGIAFWIAWLAACFAGEGLAHLSPARFASAEEVLGFLTRHLLPRIVMIGAWGYAGWHLFVH